MTPSLAGLLTEASAARAVEVNTVAAQWRILTAFPIYFLRLVTASNGGLHSDLCACGKECTPAT